MKDNIHIFENPEQLAIGLADHFRNMIVELSKTRKMIHIAISGGSTPKLFFQRLAEHHRHLPWEKIHLFWVDERCVPVEDHESNFGMTKKSLLDKIDIPKSNIHYIIGNADPDTEARRYSEDIRQSLFSHNNWPVFDWILLGLGEDGHTASLFPGSPLLHHSDANAAVAIHPQTNQKRITLTLPLINHAKNIIFLVSGHSKADIVGEIFRSTDRKKTIPATYIAPESGRVEWFLDQDAAKRLS